MDHTSPFNEYRHLPPHPPGRYPGVVAAASRFKRTAANSSNPSSHLPPLHLRPSIGIWISRIDPPNQTLRQPIERRPAHKPQTPPKARNNHTHPCQTTPPQPPNDLVRVELSDIDVMPLVEGQRWGLGRWLWGCLGGRGCGCKMPRSSVNWLIRWSTPGSPAAARA